MNDLIHRLASLKIAVGLLVAIMLAMAAGTIVEARLGTPTALATVYHAFWFRALLALFAINVACSLWDQWPWGWQRAGYALTHGSMLLVLTGAFVTDRLKVEGQLALWEGEQSSSEAAGVAGGVVDLPFSVKLDAFEIDYYQGTMRPAMFRSRVTVEDPAGGRSFPAVIEMNSELSYGGYRLFQSSYRQTPERDQTVLTVSRDPGQPLVFAGYGLLMLGMITVLGTRMAQQRAAAGARAAMTAAASARRVAAVLVFALLVAGAALTPAAAATLPDPPGPDQVRALPVQHDGRVMPLDTLARQATWEVTGTRVWDGIDPVALVLGWSLDPEGWAGEPIIPIGSDELATAIGAEPGRQYLSFNECAGNPLLMHLFQQARAEAEADRPLRPLHARAQKLEGRLIFLQGFLARETIRPVPSTEGPAARWSPPANMNGVSDLTVLMELPRGDHEGIAAAMKAEVAYNRVQPSRLAWWILVPATAVALAAWSRRNRWLDWLAMSGLLAGFLVMTWGLATRWRCAGRIPASNMYESMLFLGWGVALFALIALVFLRNRLVVFNATAMAALTMLLTDRLPMDPFIHPMPPVLSGTPWLAIHVPIIMLSYSVLALGVLVAHLQIGAELLGLGRREAVARMTNLLYWYMHAGSILLIAGILTGSIWAASSWGRYWGWDPKEVWSLIAFLVYLAILHGRLDKILGSFGVAALSIVAFWAILMTYVGVNFVLTAGLHSYGFGGSGVVQWLMIVAGMEAMFLTAGFVAHRAAAAREPATA